ncbi:MAG: hypothetical protein ACLTS6_15680 [Anaerobutyricum sp.]
MLLTKIMVNEDDVTLKLSNSGEQVEQYYVYASGVQKLKSIRISQKQSHDIRKSGEMPIDSKEKISCGNVFTADYAQVAGMDNVIKTGDRQYVTRRMPLP